MSDPSICTNDGVWNWNGYLFYTCKLIELVYIYVCDLVLTKTLLMLLYICVCLSK